MKCSPFLDNLLGCEDLTIAPRAASAVQGHDGGRVTVGGPSVRLLALGAVDIIVRTRHSLGQAGGQGPLAGLANQTLPMIRKIFCFESF